jgi:hypothetical protein
MEIAFILDDSSCVYHVGTGDSPVMDVNQKKETLSDEEILFAAHDRDAFTLGQPYAAGCANAGAEYEHHDFYAEQPGTEHAEQHHTADNINNDHATCANNPDDVR